MWKNFRLSKLLGIGTLLLSIIISGRSYALPCNGRFPNPLTDICWSCMFPIQIGKIKLNPTKESENLDPPPPMICSCPFPPLRRWGIGISFWEPARIAEVVRTPMCSPTLNGAVLGKLPVPAGTNTKNHKSGGSAFYHVHWIQYPVLNWLGLMMAGGACMVSESFDLAYFSEMDPLWDDDELTYILNPEAVLFAHPLAQAACAADSIKAAASGFGIDKLFWCSGSQGSLYPISGNHATHIGGVDSSLALVHKMIFKLHRQGQAHDTSTKNENTMCNGWSPQSLLRKNQYKQQMLFPVPQNIKGYGLGAPSMLWGAGKEFPYKGEDFSYLVWRKRTCCAY